MNKGPQQQTKAQRDATLNSATKGPASSPKQQHLQKVQSGSTRRGAKHGK